MTDQTRGETAQLQSPSPSRVLAQERASLTQAGHQAGVAGRIQAYAKGKAETDEGLQLAQYLDGLFAQTVDELAACTAVVSAEADREIEALLQENIRLREALSEKISSTSTMSELVLGPDGVNATLEGGLARVVAEIFAEQFRNAGAENFFEMQFTAKDGLELSVTLQKRDGQTPGNLLTAAKAELAATKERLQALEAVPGEQPVNAARYRHVRTLQPAQFTELYVRNLHTRTPFDTLVDENMAARLSSAA